MNRVSSDSSLMFPISHTSVSHVQGREEPVQFISFYDSSDTDSNCDELCIPPRWLWNRSAQSLSAKNDEIPWNELSSSNRMCQSVTDPSGVVVQHKAFDEAGIYLVDAAGEALSAELSNSGIDANASRSAAALADVTRDICDRFHIGDSGEELGMISSRKTALLRHDHSQSFDHGKMDAKSARERRRKLNETRNLLSQDNLPRLERSRATPRSDSPDGFSPVANTASGYSKFRQHAEEHCSSQARSHDEYQRDTSSFSRPSSSNPNSRSQSPRTFREKQECPKWLMLNFVGPQQDASLPYESGHRSQLLSDEANDRMSDGSNMNIGKARSFSCFPGHYGADGGSEASTVPVAAANLLDIPNEALADDTNSILVRSSSDVIDGKHEDNRRGRRQRRYNSDPFTSRFREDCPVTRGNTMEGLNSYDVHYSSFDHSPGVSGYSSSDRISETGDQEDAGKDNRIIERKHKASVCDDCEDVFHPTAPLRIDRDFLCKKCTAKRLERRAAILEIVETELSFGRDLRLVKEEFYLPMRSNSLLTAEQISNVFLNLQELIDINKKFASSLDSAARTARGNGEEDFNSVHIGRIFLDNSFMFIAFENYCTKQATASLLLERLERDKELLRIFLQVSQAENPLLRRMNLKSFLMIPVQRIFKYPLLLHRLFNATPAHHKDLHAIKEAHRRIEEILSHINAATKSSNVSSMSRMKTKGSINRKAMAEDFAIQKVAFTLLGKNRNEAVVTAMGKMQCALPTELSHWTKKSKPLKYSPVHALILCSGQPVSLPTCDDGGLIFPKESSVSEATLVLLREKNAKYVPLRDTVLLNNCVVSFEHELGESIEVHEMNKDTILLKAANARETSTWLKTLKNQAKDVGLWRRRRKALANIMFNKPSTAVRDQTSTL